jgi:hypothetical protein
LPLDSYAASGYFRARSVFRLYHATFKPLIGPIVSACEGYGKGEDQVEDVVSEPNQAAPAASVRNLYPGHGRQIPCRPGQAGMLEGG